MQLCETNCVKQDYPGYVFKRLLCVYMKVSEDTIPMIAKKLAFAYPL
jgi:hypothetical protein